MSNQNIQIYTVYGATCTTNNYAIVSPLGYESNTSPTQLKTNRYYLLADGDLVIEDVNSNTTQTISSAYPFGWSNYIDHWTYNQDLILKVTPSTIFYSACRPMTSAEYSDPYVLNIKLGKIQANEISSIETNANSTLIVLSNNFIYNGNTVNSGKLKMNRFSYETNENISIGSIDSTLYCLLIE